MKVFKENCVTGFKIHLSMIIFPSVALSDRKVTFMKQLEGKKKKKETHFCISHRLYL